MSKGTWIIVICAFFVLLLCCSLFLPIPVEIKKEITIESSIVNVSGQVTDLRNWKHWYPFFEEKDTSSLHYSYSTTTVNSFLHFDKHQYTIVNVNAAAITIKEETDGRAIYQSLTAEPDSFGRFTHVRWIKAITPFIWLKERFSLTREMRTGLNNLKIFMEDPNQLYGFPIEIRPTADTLVIIKEAVISKKDAHITLQGLYSDLHQYILSNNINSNGQRMAGFVTMENYKMKVTAGVPVNKKVPEKNGISYLRMPASGRMLVGKFEGAYQNINQLYNAMDRYIADKSLRKVALSYEKYLTDPQSSLDSLHMKIEVYFPIY